MQNYCKHDPAKDPRPSCVVSFPLNNIKMTFWIDSSGTAHYSVNGIVAASNKNTNAVWSAFKTAVAKTQGPNNTFL